MARLLVVDDDPDVVEAIRLFLEKDGHEVEHAYSREDGNKAIKAFSPDLLILDVMMDQPDDGLVMARELRSDGFQTPILMLTSISKVTGMEFGKDSEMIPVDEFLEKPVDPKVLAEKVYSLLALKEG
ncbi:MAG: response regulator transcription factor [Phycisphaerae bacterium]